MTDLLQLELRGKYKRLTELSNQHLNTHVSNRVVKQRKPNSGEARAVSPQFDQ